MSDETKVDAGVLERRKKGRLRMLQRRCDRAVKLGAMDQEEADRVMTKAEAMDWASILELIMLIIELIQEWLANR
jgi:hypothetical protein